MIQPVTRDHLEAVNKKTETRHGLKLRAEYCDFMSLSARTPAAAALWNISAERRRQEAE